MNLPQFITVNATIEGFKTKCLLRIDRIHCISEVMLGEPTKVIIHYNLPNSSELETLVVDETMQEINRMLFHITTGIPDIGCGVPFPKKGSEPSYGILRTTGIEESPQFT